MTIKLTTQAMREIFPKAPQAIIESFVKNQDLLTKAGINHTRQRLAYFFANIEHECNGFTIKGLTENINYSHAGAAEIFGHRIGRTAEEVEGRFGNSPGWQKDMIDVVYGNRMGNGPPETHDGSRYIGRGGPQWTGKDGYRELQRRTGLDAVLLPEKAAENTLQAEVCVAFWDWKKMNVTADTGNFRQCVKRWNGGTNGMADRLSRMAGNDPFIARLEAVENIRPMAEGLLGKPPTPLPPNSVVNEATKKERNSRRVGVAGAATGGADESVGAVAPEAKVLPSYATYAMVGIGIAVVLIATWLIAVKVAKVRQNWR